MRRMVALLAALVLTASLAYASAAAGPPSQVNSFVGNFDLVGWDMETPIAHIVANVREADDAALVPGSLDIYWAEDSLFWTWDGSQYYEEGRVPRESHGQLFSSVSAQNTYSDMLATEVFITGYLCHYWDVGDATCEPFMMDFRDLDIEYTPHRVGGSRCAAHGVVAMAPGTRRGTGHSS